MRYIFLLFILFSSISVYSQNTIIQFDVNFEYCRINEAPMEKCKTHIKITNNTIFITGTTRYTGEKNYNIIYGIITAEFRAYLCNDDTEIIWDSDSHKIMIFYPMKKINYNNIKVIQFYSTQ